MHHVAQCSFDPTHKCRVCADNETCWERGSFLCKLRDSLPVSSWVWISFVTSIMLLRHVASLEWELIWISVKFVPYSVNYSISVWIDLFLVWIRPINGMNLQSLDVNSTYFGVNNTLLVWLHENGVKHTWWCESSNKNETSFFGVKQNLFLVTYCSGVKTNIWCDPNMLVWINKCRHFFGKRGTATWVCLCCCSPYSHDSPDLIYHTSCDWLSCGWL